MPPEPFDLPIRVEAGDIDELGHVNNVVYVRWVQQAATAHWQAAAPPPDQEKLRWVVVRHEIDYKSPAFAGERLIARTWVGKASRVAFERLTEIMRDNDGTVLVRARTLWCPIDPASGKPVGVGQEVRRLFSSG
jgi:acyl-CoA thioester hydrolase